jgi:hypothetical protein
LFRSIEEVARLVGDVPPAKLADQPNFHHERRFIRRPPPPMARKIIA